ncbi:DUF7139 domain-containing protein [Natrialbaceae archaeon A-gly3]
MTSLTEVYEANEREVSSLRRLYAGTGLVVLGAVLAVVAVLIATTDLFSPLVGDEFGAIRWAGILAGLGVPAVLVGVFTVLPAGRTVRAAAAIGASICLLGVVLFSHAYPHHWRGHGDQLTLEVSVVYLFGLFIAFWCLFVAVANFKTRNDPGGTVEMNVTRRGKTKIVEVEDSSDGLGGVGFFGTTPDGEVETQTGERNGDANAETASPPTPPGGPTAPATSDGGSAASELSSPLDGGAEVVEEDGPSPTDRYCGNCTHFEYIRSSNGMTPYCRRHDEAMDDMDACEEWEPNHS